MNSVFDITLNARMTARECMTYTGHWCEFCDKDNGGGKFCYECGQRESEGWNDDEPVFDFVTTKEGVWLNRCDRCDKRTAATLCPFTKDTKFEWSYECVACQNDDSRYANPEDFEDDLFAALMAEAENK